MVKKSERIRAYHPRGPHKDGCLCVVCKAKMEAQPPAEPRIVAPSPLPPGERVELLVRYLGEGTTFWFAGKQYRLGKVDLYPAGQATITSLESGKESTISNHTTVLLIK